MDRRSKTHAALSVFATLIVAIELTQPDWHLPVTVANFAFTLVWLWRG